MSVRVGLEDAETVLSPILNNPGHSLESLSVDLPKGRDLYVKEQCCNKVTCTDLSNGRALLDDQRKKAAAKRKDKASKGPRMVRQDDGTDREEWPCGHPTTFADFGGCYHCHRDNPPEERELSRRRIDRRQRAAQRLLVGCAPLFTPMDTNGDDQLGKKRRGKWFPVSACRIVPIDVGMSLAQWSNGKVDRYGVFHCGSVWTCPSCSQRVSVSRSAEIRDVQIAIREDGGITFMITWTIPHDRETPLKTSLDRLKRALRLFRQDKTIWKRLIEDLGYIGHVTSTEITLALKMDPRDPLTYFDNGWHVHAHSMMAFKFPGATVDSVTTMTLTEDAEHSIRIKDLMFAGWCRAVRKAGAPRDPSYEHGFDVRVAWSATTYIAKCEAMVERDDAPEPGEKQRPRWGVEAELTKSFMKEGRKKSRTPFELLDSDDPKDHELFRTYARATFGLSQIEWSRGNWDLRRRYLPGFVKESSDEDVAAAEPNWEFADERRATGGDHVVEQVFIARDDCWRARRLGRNAMARAIADVDGGGCESLEDALRQNGFVVERVEAEHVGQRLVLDDDLCPMTKREYVWVGNDESEWTELQWVDVMEDVYIPKMVWVSFPDRPQSDHTPKASADLPQITAADLPF